MTRFRFYISLVPVLLSLTIVSHLVYSQDCDLIELTKRYQSETDPLDRFDINLQLGECYLNNNPDSALIFFDQAREIAEYQDNLAFIAKAYHRIGVYYKTIGDYNLSIENTITALKFYDETDNVEGVIDGNALLGHNYALRKEYEFSLKHYDESIMLAEESGKDSKKIGALIGKGNVLFYIDSLSLASLVFEEAIKYTEKYNSGSLVTRAGLYNNTGNIYLNNEEYPKAIKNYTKAFDMYFGLNNKFGMSLLAYNLGDAYLGVNNYDSSLKYCNINLFLAKDLKSQEEIKYAYQGLTNLYEQKKQYDSAFKYHQLYISYKDSIRDIEYSGKVDALVNEYKDEKQKKELLAANDQLKQGKTIQEQSDRIIYLLLIGGVVLLALFLASFWMYRRSQSANQLVRTQSKLISDKNESIDKALIQKDILLKEVHHRVKNNLQIIASLLNLQTKKLENQVAIQAIEDSKNRVQAIALMHKSLYQDEHLDKVDIKTYIDDLIVSHKALFVSEKNKLSFDVQVGELMSTVDDAVPLGLVVSELISNSIKHAFDTSILEPKITLSLKTFKDEIIIQYGDNGIGVNEDFDIHTQDSLGFEIITALTDQIKGQITVVSKKPLSLEIVLNK